LPFNDLRTHLMNAQELTVNNRAFNFLVSEKI
jgi:hypothetical protein